MQEATPVWLIDGNSSTVQVGQQVMSQGCRLWIFQISLYVLWIYILVMFHSTSIYVTVFVDLADRVTGYYTSGIDL